MIATETPSGGQSAMPSHPGAVLASEYMEPLDLTVTDVAETLGVTRKTLSALLNGRQGISAEMAVRLGLAFGVSATTWLDRQQAYDLANVDRRTIRVRPLPLKALRAKAFRKGRTR